MAIRFSSEPPSSRGENMIYHQLTQEERYQIEAGICIGMRVNEIAKRLDRHRSTVFRELKRNGHITREGYSGLNAQHQYLVRKEKANGRFVIKQGMRSWIDRRLKLQWSPEQVVGRRKLEKKSPVGIETVYRYIYRDKLSGGELWKNLRHSKGKRRRRFPRVRWPSSVGRLNASDRPMVIEKRQRKGDFERDLIVGARRQGHLLTLVDRKTKLVRLAKPQGLSAKYIHSSTINSLRGLKIKSLTNDNGLEFIAHKKTARALGVKVYFTRPYASWERGTVENTNKLIRQYFPKTTNLREVSYEKIKMVQMLLNRRPRKSLGYRTPEEAHHRAA